MRLEKEFITPMISAVTMLTGTLIGSFFSWVITKKSTHQNIKEQYKIINTQMAYEERYKLKRLCEFANILRLDICTAIFQSIRTLKDIEANIESINYPIPINKNYSLVVSSLSDRYSLKELSYLYQLYSILEKVNGDILRCDIIDESCIKKIKRGYTDILKKIFAVEIEELLKLNTEGISYEEIISLNVMKPGYQEVLKKLDYLCFIENLTKNN